MPTFTLEELVTGLLVVVAFIILALILVALKIGGGFFYAGCEGEPEGARCSGDVVGGTNISVGSCGTDIKTVQAIDSPRCNIYKTYAQCVLTSYAPVKQENKSISVCLWVESSADPAMTKNCLLNSELGCEDFTQATVPKCQDVPGCRAITAVKRAIEELKPEKCIVGVGSTCLI
jgi:hypothetical protein